jgi:Leucine-rich repeat (LRR) protein
MSKSQFVLPVLGLLAIIAFATIVTVSSEIFGGCDESQAQATLMKAGALVVMNSGGKCVGTVNLSTITDKSKLAELLRIMADLQELQALNLNNTSLGHSELQIVGSMRSLVSLSLMATEIGDEGVAHLTELNKLESLHLNSTSVSDEGLDHLSKLNGLKVLDLSGTQVKSDLVPLSQLENLEWLVLGNLSLSDNSLRGLEEGPKLKRLTLRGSTYPESAAKQLSAKRPEIRIDN